MSWGFILLVFTSFLFSVHSFDNYSSESLNFLVQDFAFKTLVKHKPHTGALYNALLPTNLSGMDVSVVKVRSRRLWKKGANFSHFHIPSRTMAMPHVKRLAIVYQNLGNWSSHYYNVPGYSLLTYVVGFMVFDASNVSDKRAKELSLNTMGQQISVDFPNIKSLKGMVKRAKCVEFDTHGTFNLSKISLGGVCYSRENGHFSIVVPLDRKPRMLYLWVGGFVLGFVGLIIVGYAGIVLARLLKSKKIQVMERHAGEDLVLENRWIGGSKMPAASVTRTQPTLETGVP